MKAQTSREIAQHDSERTPFPSERWFRLLWLLLRSVPNRYGSKPRVALLRRAGARVGSNVTIGPRVRVLGPAGLTIEDGVGIARDALLDGRGGIHLEAGSMIGFESILLTWTHNYDDPSLRIADQGSAGRALTVGARAWLGMRVIVLPGMTIGSGAVVGAGSVVTRSVAPSKIVAGNPARELRDR